MFKGVNVCVYVGEGLRRSFATPDPFVLTNKICLKFKPNIFYYIFMTEYEKGLGKTKKLCLALSLTNCV